MKELPKNFTDEEHAAWVKKMYDANRRNELIGGAIAYGIIGLFLLWAGWDYIDGDKKLDDWRPLVAIGIAAYYELSRKLDKILDKMNQ